MRKYYTYAIIPACGLGLIGASQSSVHSGERKIEQHLTATDSRKKNVANFVMAKAAPALRDTGCERGKDDRRSGLCAEWKAADAAYDSATYGRWQLICQLVGLVTGGLTLFFAGWAAHWAKRAAYEAKRGADAAEKSLEHERSLAAQQSRPWVVYDTFSTDYFVNAHTPEGIIKSGLLITPQLLNTGSIPAQNISIQETVCFPRIDDPLPDLSNYLTIEKEEHGVCAPGKLFKINSRPLYGETLSDLTSRRRKLIVTIYIEYSGPGRSDRPYRSVSTREFTYGGERKKSDGEYQPFFNSRVVTKNNFAE